MANTKYSLFILRIFLFTIWILLNSLQAFSQFDTILLNKDYDNLKWEVFIEKLESESSLRFFFDQDSIPGAITTHIQNENTPLFQYLEELFLPHNIKFSTDKSGNIFITNKYKINTSLPSSFFKTTFSAKEDSTKVKNEKNQTNKFLQTSNEFIATSILIGTKKEGDKQKKATLSGHIKNAKDGSPVIGATLMIKELSTGTASDESGFYTLTLDKGKYSLSIRSLNHEEEKYELEILSDGRYNFSLQPKLIMLKGVTVSSERELNVKGMQMGYERLTTKRIKALPMVLGERDILKVALLLPGIQSVGEGAAGFNVRGSPADQNLFYINSVPIYNTSHLFGFFSAFNSDAIREFSLFKSNIPVKYGGRLASIFEVTTKQGNLNNFSARGGISPITGSILFEGPIQKEKSSFLVGIRSTYSDWMLKLIKDPDFKNSSAKFADGVANIYHEINPNNQIKLFGYYSFDKINFAARTKFDYENAGTSLNWNHIIKNKHNFNLTIIYSKYRLHVQNEEFDLASYENSNQLEHTEIKGNLTLRPGNNHVISTGISSTLYEINSGDFLPLSAESLIEAKDLGQERGIESGLYLSEEWDISPNFSINGGLRYNFYSYLGPQTVFEYIQDAPKNLHTITDTLQYPKNKRIKSYNGLDFRMAAKYLVNSNLSFKLSYNQLHQYIFMLTNTIALSPSDKWKLSDYNVKPMKGEQFSFGVFSNFGRNTFESSIEAYLKRAKNLIQFKDGADLIVNEVPEWDILQGDLDSYGIELSFKKPHGKLNGWINYTFSKATVLVDGTHPEEKTNFGNPYPANYERPHAFNLVTNYNFSRRLNISANWVYSSGRPATFPAAIYYQDNNPLLHYSERNEFRLPDYFRMDVSVKLEGNLRAKKLAHGSWVFSIYNLTGRKNPYSIYFKSEQGNINGYKLSVFGTPIVSLTYNFKLGNYAN
ncbi:MAG: TonB-dependent receptor [Bacteroidetes bacterium]|nr:TonB-dependent receptor [Bacteroidota bacterium]